MPSNLYGVSNAPIVTAFSGQQSISCPAGATTVVAQTPAVIAPSQGFYYPACWWLLDFTYGATLPAVVVFSFRLFGGSNLDAVQLNMNAAAANQTVDQTICMFGPPSSTPWIAPGTVMQFCMTPTGQAVQCNAIAGRVWFAIFRAPDQ